VEGVDVVAEKSNEAACAGSTETDRLDVREEAEMSVAVSDHDPGVRNVTEKEWDPASEAWKLSGAGSMALESVEVKRTVPE
jgi:hypothetical protein